MTKKLSKRGLLTIIVLGVVLAALSTVTAISVRELTSKDCSDSRQDRMGECLPDGQCIAPNDGLVNCDVLDQDGDYKVEPAGIEG